MLATMTLAGAYLIHIYLCSNVLTERYHSSCVWICTEEPTSGSSPGSDGFAFVLEVSDRLGGAAATGDSRFTSESH